MITRLHSILNIYGNEQDDKNQDEEEFQSTYVHRNITDDAHTISMNQTYQVSKNRTGEPLVLSPKQYDEFGNVNQTVPPSDIEEIGANVTITVVIELSGEMGNHLSKLAHGYAQAWELEDQYGIHTSIWLRHQGRPKWVRGRDSMNKCFPMVATMDFERGNTEEFLVRKKDSTDLGLPPTNLNLSELANFIQNNEVVPQNGLDPSVPFIHADLIGTEYVDKYLKELKELFKFDYGNPSCCNPDVLPEPDETTFHFRNFKKEIPRVYKRLGFQELGPNQTAQELFGNHAAGDKVAILTRFEEDKDANSLADILREKLGLTVRLIAGNSGEQDFCFLLKTKKEIIGGSKSTFFTWAGLLGEAKKVHTYHVGSKPIPSMFRNNKLEERLVISVHVQNSTLDPNWRRRYLRRTNQFGKNGSKTIR